MKHRPDFFLINEPWIDFQHVPSNWSSKLGLKIFSLNDRHNLHPNICCICSISLVLNIIDISNQHVNFTLSKNSKVIGISIFMY